MKKGVRKKQAPCTDWKRGVLEWRSWRPPSFQQSGNCIKSELDRVKKVLKQIAGYRASELFWLKERKNRGCYMRRIGNRLKGNSGKIPALLDLSFPPG